MKYNRRLFLAIAVYISQLKFSRQTEVKLAGRKCILITNSRFYVYVKLRSVESSLADFLCILDTKGIHNLTKCIFCFVPHFIIIMIFLFVFRITQRQYASVICDTEIFVSREDQVYYFGELIFDLLRSYKQMCIILAEMTSTLDTF